jgi:glycosyltransferase involved in cell wall biosynthesis
MLTNLFHPVATGSSTQVRGLSKALAAAGHHVIVITAHVDKQTAPFEHLDGFDVYRVPALHLPKMAISLNFPWLNWVLWPANLKRIEAIIRKHDIDVLHVHNHMFDMAFVGALLKRRLGLPLALTMHTVIKHANPAYDAVLRTADRVVLKSLVIDKVDRLICPDNNMRAYVEERFGRRDSSVVVYGVDHPDRVTPEQQADLRKTYGLDGRPLILSVGHVHAIRNRHELIRALPRVSAAFPDVLLLVVGGVFDDSAQRLAEELGVAGNVLFVGAQPRSSISAFLSVAHIEAHWLNQDEGTWASPGLASMEAMYAGLPVFTVAPEGIYGEGVLCDGVNIVLVKRNDVDTLAERLIELLGNAGQRHEMGRAASETCERFFCWPRVAAQTADRYRHMASVVA